MYNPFLLPLLFGLLVLALWGIIFDGFVEFGISAACLMIKLCKIVTEPLLKMEFWMVGLVWWSVSGPLRRRCTMVQVGLVQRK